jgi:hypothetical protein
MPPLLGHMPFLWITHKENEPREPKADWWVLTTVNTAETNGLTCLAKHEGARDNKFLAYHLMTDQRCLTSAIIITASRSSSSSLVRLQLFKIEISLLFSTIEASNVPYLSYILVRNTLTSCSVD